MNEIQFKSSYRCWYIFKKIQIPWYTKKNDKNDPNTPNIGGLKLQKKSFPTATQREFPIFIQAP